MAEDAHRGSCSWDGKSPSKDTKWGSLLDWAVYHAPGWQGWQKFREDLTKMDMNRRANAVSAWANNHSGLANLVRCVNVLRSLRGNWSSHPQMKTVHDRLTTQMDKAWKGETKKSE